MQWKSYGVVVVVLFMLTACSESSHLTLDDEQGSDSVGGGFSLSVPASIANARAVDLDALYPQVVVNGVEQLIDEDELVTNFSVPNGSTLDISVKWFERQEVPREDLLLASWSYSQPVSENTSITVASEDYKTQDADPVGGEFDVDGDGFSNLSERRADSDPYNPNETPLVRPVVRIGWINPTEVPVIDGLYDSIWNTGAQFSDVEGETLWIDNLMINQGAVRTNGNAEMRWFAMHDDSNLYVFVLGEDVDEANPMRDSTDVWQDDNVNIFVNGNNSEGSTYDGVDDMHIFVPLLTDPENPTQNSTVFVNSERSAYQPAFEFSTCLCTDGVHTWEFKLPFSEFNIVKGVPFGFDIQIDLDHDGGARDARWGWAHPARTNQDIDYTYLDPSYMGTVIVE